MMVNSVWKMQVYYLCLSALWIGAFCQSSNDDDDGQYHPGKYLGPDGEDGQYVHDNSGQYVTDNSGLYKYDATGIYRPETPGFFRAKGNLNKYRSSGNFAGNSFTSSKSKFGKINLVRPNNQLKDFEDDFGNKKSPGKSDFGSSSNFDDEFLSSTIAPLARILHRKPLKDVEFFRKPSTLHSGSRASNFFGDSAAGTAYNPKSTHLPIRFPSKYTQGRYDESGAQILKQNGDVAPDGYHWDFETENGIKAEETGKVANKGSDLEAMRAKGFYKYTGPDNKVYSVMYTADENGFVAQGNHLPTPPPIPDEILKSLNGLNYQRGGGARGKF